ncbi:FAD binding domain-containing protein [Spirochaetota bacterium]
MRIPEFQYEKPASLEQCFEHLEKSRNETSILAGGSDLLINMKLGVAMPRVVMSIRSLDELNSLNIDENDNLHIGACCTLSQLAAENIIRDKFPALFMAIKYVASMHIRNVATIGGNLCLDTRCWYFNQSKSWRASRKSCYKTGGNLCHAVKNSKRCHAINKSDIAPVLMVMDAEVVVKKSGNERRIKISEFFADNGLKPNLLEVGGILTEIIIPPSPREYQSTFLKVANRRGIDFALGSIAVSINKNAKGVSGVSLILGSLRSSPVQLKKTAAIILESGLTDKSIENASETAVTELGTVTNIYTSAGYKRDLVRALVKKALHKLINGK